MLFIQKGFEVDTIKIKLTKIKNQILIILIKDLNITKFKNYGLNLSFKSLKEINST